MRDEDYTKQISERITVIDGEIPLVGVLERPSAEPGPLVVVLHGFTSSKDRPHTLAACEAMREAGFSTLRFDLYGHGESGGEFRDHTLHKWISNTLAVMDWAEQQAFVTELWLSGHSQGGLTAALAAGKAPDRVRGLILRAPAFMIPRGAREGLMLGVRFDPARIPARFPTIKGLTLEEGYLRSAQAIRVEEAVDAFPGPVLLLHGEADDVVPLSDVAAAAGRYRNCRLELIPGETHHFDRAREQMKAIIKNWLIQQKGAQEDGSSRSAGMIHPCEKGRVDQLMSYEIVPLPKEKWKGTVIPFRYTTEACYDLELTETDDSFQARMVKKRFDAPVTHTPEEYNFPDRLYQDYWEKAEAWGILSGETGELLACIELCPEEWSNRLMVTELWVTDRLHRQGLGTRLMDLAKRRAKEQGRRAIILETQSCNVRAIAFYRSQGFRLIGFDSCCYANNDIARHEIRFNFGFFLNTEA